METDLKVPARYYARIAEVLPASLDELAGILGRLGLSIEQLAQPEAMIRTSQVDRLILAVAAKVQRSDLGYQLGKLLSANSHSFVGFGMLNSATLEQALRFEAQYFRLVMPSFHMRYVSGPDFCDMRFTPRVAMSHLSLSFHLEAIGTAALREVSDLTLGRRPPCILDLSIPEPAHSDLYRTELKDVRVRFAADVSPSVKLRVMTDPRALKLDMADSHALRVAESRCRSMVQHVAEGGRFADWVAMTLREVSEGLPSLGELARNLNLSKRTLNRYLRREGTSFRELSARIQHEIACERLAAGMSATEVAYSLGFSDPSNFNKAFRSRAGYSPGKHAGSI